MIRSIELREPLQISRRPAVLPCEESRDLALGGCTFGVGGFVGCASGAETFVGFSKGRLELCVFGFDGFNAGVAGHVVESLRGGKSSGLQGVHDMAEALVDVAAAAFMG